MLSLTSAAQAQFGHRKPPPPSSAQRIDCQAIAANPMAGMDLATCEKMKEAADAYNSGRNDPSGARPGDEAMTCDDIKAEFMRQPIARPDRRHVAEAQAAASDFQGKMAVEQAKVAAATVELSAETTAASAAGMANPVAGRAADQAVEAHRRATEAALNADAKVNVLPAARRMNSGAGELIGDMSAQLQNNPRLAHLVSMIQEKRCR
jgi:hypothetical protein